MGSKGKLENKFASGLFRSSTPPLGPRPKFVIEQERFIELKHSIMNFIQSNWPIPVEHIIEYNELADKLPKENSAV